MLILSIFLLLAGIYLIILGLIKWREASPSYVDTNDPISQGKTTFFSLIYLSVGSVLFIGSLVWTLILSWTSIQSLHYIPVSEDYNILKIGITLFIGVILLWALTRPHADDMLYDTIGPVSVVPPIREHWIYPRFVRYAALILLPIITLVGIFINWRYILLGGLVVVLPLSLIILGYLSWGENWVDDQGSQVRIRHTFGPFSYARQFPLYSLLSYLFGCALSSLFLIICLLV